MKTFDLFYDESGQFEESALQKLSHGPLPYQGPSQIVGLLAPGNEVTEIVANKILATAFSTHHLTLPPTVHATELYWDQKDLYSPVTSNVLNQIIELKWQPIRIVNTEKIGFGDRILTYINMIAELIIRVFETLHNQYHEPIRLNIIGANFVKEFTDFDSPILLEHDSYKKKIIEYLSFVSVRRGVAHISRDWHFNFDLKSARTGRCLQLCDVISNASFNESRKCSDTLKNSLEQAFKPFSFTMNNFELKNTIDRCIDSKSVGIAIQTLAEYTAILENNTKAADYIETSINKLISILLNMDSLTRNFQLRMLDNWVRQLISLRKNLPLAEKIIAWLDRTIIHEIKSISCSDDDSDWFECALNLNGLIVSNHLGNVVASRHYCRKLDPHFKTLSGKWEHAPLLLECLINESVLLTDCMAFDETSTRMKAVDEYYGNLADLFSAALPDVFKGVMKSDFRGMALGTWAQNECYAGLSDPKRLKLARDLNERAIAEFASKSDIQRQYQYRCQIETIDGKFEHAREFLARSLDLFEDSSYFSIANAIARRDVSAQGFYLLHFLRIGADAARIGYSIEHASFMNALTEADLNIKSSPWATDSSLPYPSHGILRSLAVCFGYTGNLSFTMMLIGKMAEMKKSCKSQEMIRMILLCGKIEAALMLFRTSPDTTKTILNPKESEIYEDLKSIRKQLTSIPTLTTFIESISLEISEFYNAKKPDSSRLIHLLRRFGY